MNSENQHGNGVAILYHLQRDVVRLDKDVSRIDRDVVDLRLSHASLASKVGTYAALGAVLGGGAVSFLIKFLAP